MCDGCGWRKRAAQLYQVPIKRDGEVVFYIRLCSIECQEVWLDAAMDEYGSVIVRRQGRK